MLGSQNYFQICPAISPQKKNLVKHAGGPDRGQPADGGHDTGQDGQADDAAEGDGGEATLGGFRANYTIKFTQPPSDAYIISSRNPYSIH